MENTPILLHTYIQKLYIYVIQQKYIVFKRKTTAGTNVMDRVANKVVEAVERLG